MQPYLVDKTTFEKEYHNNEICFDVYSFIKVTIYIFFYTHGDFCIIIKVDKKLNKEMYVKWIAKML